jgi:hypothetical protein
MGYDLTNFSIDKLEQFSFAGLKSELDNNFALRKKYNCDYYRTEIYQSKLDWLNLTTDDGILRIHNLSAGGIVQNNSLSVEIQSKGLNNLQINNLKHMEEFPLFESFGQDNDEYWLINFGTDTKGASFLISKVLISVFGFNELSKPFYVTIVENLVDASDDDKRWWIEDTSDEYRERCNRAASKFGYFTRNSDGSYNNSSQSSANNSGCFIATATMGSYDHPSVVELRSFRDNWILKKSWGDKFVNWYYKYGSIAANGIEKSILLKNLSHCLIVKPLVYFSRIIKK